MSFYPYETAIDEIHKAAIDSYTARDDKILDEADYWGLVKNGIAQAHKKTIEQCQAEANRTNGSRHDAQINVGRSERVSRNSQRPGAAICFR